MFYDWKPSLYIFRKVLDFYILAKNKEISLNDRLIRFHDSPNFNTQEAIKLKSYFFIILGILRANFVQLCLHQLDSKILLISVTQ